MRSARDVNAEAAAWLVRNDKHAPNPEKLAGFESWLTADPRHRAAYLRLRFAWRRANLFRRMGSHDQTVDLDPLAPQSSLRGLRSAPAWGFTALAVALLALAAAAAWILQAPDWERLATQLGALDQVALADGSTIHLNSDSEVAVRLGNARRDIVLVRGEAYFAVAPDPRRPFEVEAEGVILRALGTAFSVRVRALHRVEVLVESGIVSIAQAGNRRTTLHTLFAGHTATIERGRITARRLEPHEVKRCDAGGGRFGAESIQPSAAQDRRPGPRVGAPLRQLRDHRCRQLRPRARTFPSCAREACARGRWHGQ